MNWIKALLTVCLGLFLAACGGGGSDAGTSLFGTGSGTSSTTTTTTATTAPVVSLALSSTTVTSAAPVTVTATVVNSSGSALANQVVTFKTTLGYGTLSAATALTNSSGQAVVTLTPAASTTVGADTLTASVTVNGLTGTASTGFQLTSTNVTIASFTSDIGTSALSAYGQTTLTVTVSGAATGSSVNISLTSACVTAGKVTLSPASATTTTGTATFIYKDTGGCGSILASDTVQASVTGASASKTLSIPLTSPAASSITFVTATPQQIYLSGSGYVTSSTVTFEVVDVDNNPLPGQSVSMIATTYTGGLTLDGVSTAITKTSDANGLVTVIVNSGTVPTPVRVTATLASLNVTTTSSNLSIAVGLPTETAFSLSEKTFNIEGYDIDGTSNTYTVIASDRMGNPVPAGTSVNFVSNSGQIAPVGLVALSAANLASTSVAFQTSAPRPDDGRITIVAYALGEESFIDATGSNVYVLGDDWQALGDIFVSADFSATFDASTDQRIPQTIASPAVCNDAATPALQISAYVPSVEVFDGAPRCNAAWGQAYVRRAIQTVLSTSGANAQWLGVGAGGSSGPQIDSGCAVMTVVGDTGANTTHFVLSSGGLYNLNGTTAGGTLDVLVADANTVRLNPMAAGTTITVTGSSNMTASVIGGSPVPNSLVATSAAISYVFNTGTAGTLIFSFTSPSGLITSFPVSVSTSSTPVSPATVCTQ